MSWGRLAAVLGAVALAIGPAQGEAEVAGARGAVQVAAPEVCLADPGSPACAVARVCLREPSGRECRAGLEAQGYEGAQWAVQNATAEALARVGARFAAQSTDLGRRVTEREAISARVQALDSELVASLGRADGASQTDLRVRLEVAQRALQEADDFLLANYRAYQELARPRPIGIRDTQALLKPDEALVFYMVGPQSTYVWAITRETTEWRKISLGKTALAAKIAALREGLDPDDVNAAIDAGRAPRFAFDVSHELYQLLIDPVATTINAKRRIVIAPSGPLLGLPFAVLTASPPPTGQPTLQDFRTSRWLGATKAMAILPAPSALRSLRCPGGIANGVCAPRAGRAAPRHRFIGIGAPQLNGLPANLDRPTYDAYMSCFFSSDVARPPMAEQRCIPMLEPLPGSETELRSIARRFGITEGQGLFVGVSATETQMKSLDLSANVIVIATHGLTAGNGVKTGEAGLIFTAPALQSPARPPSVIDDGYLTVSEAAQLSITADFVILSACDTARGGKIEAEGPVRACTRLPLCRCRHATGIALARGGFRRYDPVAPYDRIQSHNGSRGGVETRDGGNAVGVLRSRQAHPAYWAPFELVGN